jgi:hypothetical protein
MDTVKKDITGALIGIVHHGLAQAKWASGLSKSQLKKLGLIPNPHKPSEVK